MTITMKIRIVLCLFGLTVFFSLSVSADFVSQEEASVIASEFFSRNQSAAYNPQRYGSARAVGTANAILVYPIPATKGVVPEQELPSFYIFNRADGCGFVIVSAETGMRQILAYSDDGIFHTDQMDRGAKPFLDSYVQEVSGIRSGVIPRKSVPKSGIPRSEYKILKTANFHQVGLSFNSNYAPTIDGKSCVAGCVATAMAIVMKYHNWPKHSRGSFSYQTSGGLRLGFDFAANPFDWASMSDTPDEESSDAISMLQKACGVAVAMEYGTKESGAFQGSIDYALREYFYYDYPLYLDREEYDTESWNRIMRSEIDAGRPVLAAGSSSEGGHSFVLDGYDRDGNFHYNLGWGGANNGFYSEESISDFQFTITEAIIGVTPRDNEEQNFTSPLCCFSPHTNFDGNLVAGSVFDYVVSSLWNFAPKSFDGLINVSIYDKDLKWKGNTFRTYDQTEYPISLANGWIDIDFPQCYVPDSMQLEPTDMVFLSTSTDGGLTWKPIYSRSAELPIRYAGGYDTDVPCFSRIMFCADSCNMEVAEGNIIAGMPFAVNVNGLYNYTNKPFDGRVMLAVCDTCDWSVVHILCSDTIHYSEAYDEYTAGDSIRVFENVMIPAGLTLKPSYALALFSQSSDSETKKVVCDSGYKNVFLKLSDYMEIADGIVNTASAPEITVIYSPDGRIVQGDTPGHGLYLLQHADGSVTKNYR